MTSPASDMRDMLYVGPFPGPVSGQTVMTQLLFDHLTSTSPAGRVIAINVARGNYSSPLRNAAVKLYRALAGALHILAKARRRNVYISLNANAGMWLGLVFVWAARLGGANRVILHHHSRAHIDRSTAAMRAVARFAGPQGVHLCICPNMAQRLQARYPAIRRTAHLNNVIGLPATCPSLPQDAGRDVWRLGHMSKLSMDKGLGRTIAALEHLLAQGVPATLSLAGAFASAADRDFALTAAARLGDALQIEGLLTGPRKAEWFAQLDLFLFPSLYRNETQGIVNLEALAAGVPVIAFGGHCIEDDLAGLNGWCLPITADFSHHVAARLAEVGRKGWPQQRALAQSRFSLLHAKSQTDLSGFGRICRADALADLSSEVVTWP